MTRSVDDVDLEVAVAHGGVLGEDGDAPLPFQVHRVHDPVDRGLVGLEGPGLLEQPVDEGGLAVIDVSDDRYVAKLHGRRLKRAPLIALEAPVGHKLGTVGDRAAHQFMMKG